MIRWRARESTPASGTSSLRTANVSRIVAPESDGTRNYRFAGGEVAFDDRMQNLEAPWRHSLLKMKRLQTASVHPHYRMELFIQERESLTQRRLAKDQPGKRVV